MKIKSRLKTIVLGLSLVAGSVAQAGTPARPDATQSPRIRSIDVYERESRAPLLSTRDFAQTKVELTSARAVFKAGLKPTARLKVERALLEKGADLELVLALNGREVRKLKLAELLIS